MNEATTDRVSGGRAPMASTGRVRAPGTRKEDWIADQFRRVYDSALQDAIPPEMLDLLNALEDEDEKEEPGEGREG